MPKRRKSQGMAPGTLLLTLRWFLVGPYLWLLSLGTAMRLGWTCGTNLAGIGKAMLLYSNDYQR